MLPTRFLICLLCVGTLAACEEDDPHKYLLSANDLAAIQQAHFAYRDGWRANDSAAVMAALTPDAVLIPHHGHPEVAGASAIQEFWWPPDSPPAAVTAFDTSAGNFLEITRKQEKGDWLISHRIWNDPVAQIE